MVDGVLMSPELEGVLDLDAVPDAEILTLTCKLIHPTGAISGLLTGFNDIRDKSRSMGFDVTIDASLAMLPDALGCRAFEKVVVSLGDKTMTSRDIQDGWIQRREVLPHRTGLSLMLSVRQKDI